MLQVFDRVITSRNTDTLVMLMLIAGFALLTMAALKYFFKPITSSLNRAFREG